MYSSFNVYTVTMPSDIRTNKRNSDAATQAKQSRITSDILDRLENKAISIDTINKDHQSERDQTLFQQECLNVAIDKMQIQVELLDLRLQEAVDSLKTRINYTDSMIPMFENHQSILMDVIDKQALELLKLQCKNSR